MYDYPQLKKDIDNTGVGILELSNTAKFCEKCGLKLMNEEEAKASRDQLSKEQEDRDLARRESKYKRDLEKRRVEELHQKAIGKRDIIIIILAIYLHIKF